MILNLIFPTWMLFIFVPWLLIIAIIGNFVIDSTIYHLFLKNVSFKWDSIWKFIIRAYFLGFLADLIGAFILGLLVGTGSNMYYIYNTPYNAIAHIFTVLLTGVLIYFFNVWNFKNAGVEMSKVKKLATWMAIITMPYTFLIPAALIFY